MGFHCRSFSEVLVRDADSRSALLNKTLKVVAFESQVTEDCFVRKIAAKYLMVQHYNFQILRVEMANRNPASRPR